MNKKHYIAVLVLCLSFFVHAIKSSCFAQSVSLDPGEASLYMSEGNFLTAMKIYKALIKKDPNSLEYNYNLAICYLSTNINKSLAIPYLEHCVKQKKIMDQTWLDLGMAYHYANRFDDALNAYDEFKKRTNKEKDLAKVERQIEMCKNAKELVKFPLDVTFENLGKNVNSPFADYIPLVPADESFLVFTTRRKESTGRQMEFDGLYPSDVFISTIKNGEFSKAKSIGATVNTAGDEQAVGLSSDGKTLLIYIDRIDSAGNIYISESKKSTAALAAPTFQKMTKPNDNVNGGFEASGCLTPDADIIFFASKRGDGLGESDLYMAKKLPNGQWAMAQNLGPVINTPYSEEYPYLAADGKTLYFSSQGHSSMGGFDIFKTVWDQQNNTWSTPVNMGYPINTTDDNYNLCFIDKERACYVSAVKENGLGDLDIYRVKFNKAESNYFVFLGKITTGDSIAKKINGQITVINTKTKKSFSYTPVPSSGKYIMILTPGKYEIAVDIEGYKPLVDAITIPEIGGFPSETLKDYLLVK